MSWGCPYCGKVYHNIFLVIECRDQCYKLAQSLGYKKITIINNGNNHNDERRFARI